MAEAVTHPKQEKLDELRSLLRESAVIALAGVEGIPAPQMQRIRAGLRGKVDFRVVKNRLLERALEEVGSERDGLDQLEELLAGPTALVTTEHNPFRLFKELEATKTKAPARGGERAPEDIVVKAGDTPFKPGPVVGDLQKAGLPAAIERGKVVIRKDTTVVEAGERIPPEVAQALTRLDIHPLTVGLELRGVYEDGTLFPRDALAVDEDAILRDLQAAAGRSLALALEVGYPTGATLGPLLGRAHAGALAVAVTAGLLEPDVVPLLLVRAQAAMLGLASRLPDEARGETPPASSAPADEGEPEEEPPEAEERQEKEEAPDEGDEEAAAEGLDSLFG